MAGEADLSKILLSLQPRLNPGLWVFCSLPANEIPSGVNPLMTFRESEGLAFIISQEEADKVGLIFTFPSEWITLEIHSSLESFGLTSVVSKILADANISANIVAAYYHDHIFVPTGRGQEALALLNALAS